MIAKSHFGFLLALALGAASACATVISTTWNENTAIPDGDLNGVAFTHTLTTSMYTIDDVSVSLNIAGQFNGDLYAFLSFGNDAAILLNRVGRTGTAPYGYSDAGLNVTFNDAAPNGDIHVYRLTLLGNASTPLGTSLTGNWAPDGRLDNPFTVTTASARNATLNSFVNQNPNGDWTLFVADASGAATNTVVSWTLTVNGQIPEPATCLLLTLGLGALALWRRK